MRILLITSTETAGFSETAFIAASAGTPHEGLALLQQTEIDAVLVRCPLADCAPADLLFEIQRAHPFVPVVLHDPDGTVDDAVRLTKLGAYHYFSGEARSQEIEQVLEAAVEWRRSQSIAGLSGAVSGREGARKLVGDSRPLRNVMEIIRLVGPRKCTVLISGETGTGKELVAQAIHDASPRGRLPMVALNCSAIPENLLEAELFGHAKGAFTGAVNQRIGRFEQAHGSTLFLDEVADMPVDLQAKLLRVLQEREFQRLGAPETIQVDVRVIAATNVGLAERVRQGKFREDLYYRLNVVPISTPPLRDRRGDIPSLVRHFIAKICRNEGLAVKRISQETLDRLAAHDWPGNVRQLENAMEMAIALSGDREALHPGDFPLPSSLPRKTPITGLSLVHVPDEGLDYEATVGGIERQILEQALRLSRGNKKQAADMLRLKRTTFAAKLRSLELAPAC